MTTSTPTINVVVAALARHSGADPATIDVSKPLASVPGIESVKALRAITEVEEECGVIIPDDYLFENASVAEFSEFIDQLDRDGDRGGDHTN